MSRTLLPTRFARPFELRVIHKRLFGPVVGGRSGTLEAYMIEGLGIHVAAGNTGPEPNKGDHAEAENDEACKGGKRLGAGFVIELVDAQLFGFRIGGFGFGT